MTAFENDVGLDGGVAARVENLASFDEFNIVIGVLHSFDASFAP